MQELREALVSQLVEEYSGEAIEMDEFERRVNLVEEARTEAD